MCPTEMVGRAWNETQVYSMQNPVRVALANYTQQKRAVWDVINKTKNTPIIGYIQWTLDIPTTQHDSLKSTKEKQSNRVVTLIALSTEVEIMIS